jgi:VanZ family protein
LRLALYIIVAGLMLVLHLYHPPQRGLWARTFFDSLHVPVFGLIALSLYVALPSKQGVRRFIYAFVATAALGVLSEAAQIYTARDASVRDLIADLFGAAGFLVAAVALTPRSSMTAGRRAAGCVVAIALLAWPLLPLAKISASYAIRNSQLPLLANFDSKFGDAFIRKQNVDFQIVRLPDGSKAAYVTFGAGPWPGVAFHDLWPDWLEYSVLAVDLSTEENEPLDINIRVHDLAHLRHDQMFSDRFNRSFTLGPGRHVLRIPLNDIQQAPRDRTIDLSKMEGIIIFGRSSIEKRSFYVHEISLQ